MRSVKRAFQDLRKMREHTEFVWKLKAYPALCWIAAA
jgi:hypothetical protein